MAPTNTGAKDREENSPRSSSAKEPLDERGRRPARPGGLIGAKIMAAAMGAARRTPRSVARRWQPQKQGDNNKGTEDSLIGGKDMAPTKTGANKEKEKSPRSRAVKNISLRGRAAR